MLAGRQTDSKIKHDECIHDSESLALEEISHACYYAHDQHYCEKLRLMMFDRFGIYRREVLFSDCVISYYT